MLLQLKFGMSVFGLLSAGSRVRAHMHDLSVPMCQGSYATMLNKPATRHPTGWLSSLRCRIRTALQLQRYLASYQPIQWTIRSLPLSQQSRAAAFEWMDNFYPSRRPTSYGVAGVPTNEFPTSFAWHYADSQDARPLLRVLLGA